MLMHAERACAELEAARLRLRVAANQEVNERLQQRLAEGESLDSASVPRPAGARFN
ncbi:MAG TPA: hypothetical protein VH374_06875 [Polyangia bacterium]|nr:hypothetical protein [Polyangia bacterium]